MEDRIMELEIRNADLVFQLNEVKKIKDIFKVVPFSKHAGSQNHDARKIPSNDIVVLDVNVPKINSDFKKFELNNIPNTQHILEHDNEFYDFSILKEKVERILNSSLDEDSLVDILYQKDAKINELERYNQSALYNQMLAFQYEIYKLKNALRKLDKYHRDRFQKKLRAMDTEYKKQFMKSVRENMYGLTGENSRLKNILDEKISEIVELKFLIESKEVQLDIKDKNIKELEKELEMLKEILQDSGAKKQKVRHQIN